MVYVYRCRDCGHQEEREYPMGEQPGEIPCGKCRGVARRVFTVPMVRYVGLGWTTKYGGISDAREAPPEDQFDDLLEG